MSNYIIEGDVTIGRNVKIGHYAVITGPCHIGHNVYIGAHAVIGAPPQHADSYPANLDAPERYKGVRIISGATIREFVTVHQGVVRETQVCAEAHVMAYSHISHDSIVYAGATLGTGTTLGGFTIVGNNATTGQSVVTHPWVVLGEGSMVGLNSSVLRDVQPYAKVAGAPARLLGSNTHKAPTMPAEYRADLISEEEWAWHQHLLDEQEKARAAWRSAA